MVGRDDDEGVQVDEPEGFRDFVAARSPALVRSAWLLTGNEASAQDLVQTALAKTWERWARVIRQEAPEAYVRTVMMSTYLTWRRRRWHGELPVATMPDGAEAHDAFADADLRASVAAALRALPRRQRAVVVLRYFDDLTEVQAAAHARLLGRHREEPVREGAREAARRRAGGDLARGGHP